MCFSDIMILLKKKCIELGCVVLTCTVDKETTLYKFDSFKSIYIPQLSSIEMGRGHQSPSVRPVDMETTGIQTSQSLSSRVEKVSSSVQTPGASAQVKQHKLFYAVILYHSQA